MAMQCEFKQQAAQPVLAIRTRTAVQNLKQTMGQSFGAVAQYLGELGQAPAGPPFAAYHNMDMQNLDVELGFPVAKVLPGKGQIQAGQIPAGTVASCLYTGPYEGLAQAYEALSQWMKDKGCEATGVAYEMYLNDPSQTPPQQLQTLIMFPIAEK